MTTEWRYWFAWLPVSIDGRTYWGRLVQRRRYVVSLGEVMGSAITSSCWQYRLKPEGE